ncbi:unnamed protein product [Trichobilharzia szidati]|nr:unnamed protein product [Trichobilharzia szidati]CAH8821820.1 unnamed protein product [Trichobilharzia szidati]CAH8821821.1 unnamed protein product [Trichobilharzia szidati]
MSETTGIWTKSCCISKRLDGKLAIVTGSSAGIGLITAGELARRGAKVIMACRNLSKAEGVRKQLLEKYGVNNPDSVNIDIACKDVTQSLSPIKNDQLIIEQLDLASLDSVRQFADRINSKYTELDILINNAGLIVGKYEKTVDGFEMTIGVNRLGHFLLTELLLPLLKRSAPSRIINVSYMAHYAVRLSKPDLQLPEGEYSELKAYSQSKLANAMHAVELSERLQNSGVTVVSLHPGAVKTEIQSCVKGFFSKMFVTLV